MEELELEQLLNGESDVQEPKVLTPEAIKQQRYSKLDRIFTKAERGIRKLSIDKDYLKSDSAINAQIQTYEAMYENAKRGLYDEDTNNAIIQANENAKALVAPIILLMNNVRSLIAYKIETEADDVDALLELADNVKLEKDELTAEKLEELKEAFGV